MKKLMSRLVLALLVAALVCAMIPAALADGTLTLSETTKKVLVGESVSFPTATYDGTPVTVTWKQGETDVTAAPSTASAGTTTYTASYTPEGEGATPVTANFTVTVVAATVTSYTNPAAVTKPVGTTDTALGLPANVTANFGEGLTRTYPVAWACESYNKDTAGTYTFTGTVTLSTGVTAEGVAAPTATVTLANKPTITISTQPQDTKIKKDTTSTPSLTVVASAKGSDGTTALSGLTYQWKSSTSKNGTFTAISGETGSALTLPKTTVGVTYYKCEVSVTEASTGLTTTLESSVAKVEVCAAYQITLSSTNKDKSIVVGTDSLISATVKEFDESTKEYKTAENHNKLIWSVDANKKYAVLQSANTGKQLNATLYTEGVSKVAGDTVTVTATMDGATECYGTAEFKVLPGTAQDITYRAYNGGVSFNASDFMSAVKYAANDATMEYVLFSVSSSDGTLYKTSSMTSQVTSATECAYDASGSQADLDDLYFVPKNTTKSEISYVAYNSDDAIIATGKVVVSGTYGDIEYETVYGQSVTFDEDDFDKFFRSEYTNGDLDYVVFDVSYDDDLDTKTYGYLYETSKGSTLVGKRDKYYFEASASQSDLDDVTFTAGTYTKKYTLTIPFTAYGEDRNGRDKEIDGYVTITVNDGSSSSIYSIGTSFEKLADAMIPDGYTTTSSIRSLSVIFDTVTNGRLFYDYDSIADASTVDLDDDEFYFSPTSTKALDLEEVYFVPAAGATTAKITYTVYDGSTKVDTGSLSFSIVQQTKSNYFSDVTATTNGTWSANAIDFMSYNELVTGTSSKAFSPNMTMTRAMLVTILYRIEGKPTVNITNPFTDVKKGSYYYDAVLWAYKNDIVTGTTKTSFDPDGAVTREQIAAILYRYAGTPKTSGTLTGYTDRAKVSSYAETALAWAVKNGIITSKSSKTLTLDPAGKGTRAEVAVMLHRYLTK